MLTFSNPDFTRRAPIPFNSKVKTHVKEENIISIEPTGLVMLDYCWSEWKQNILPFYLFYYIFFSRAGRAKLRERLSGRGGQTMGTVYLCFSPTRCEMALGLKQGWSPKVSLSLQGAPALPSPLVSVPAQHGPAWSPNRLRRGPPSAANPTEWLPLSGQELKRKILQALTTAVI